MSVAALNVRIGGDIRLLERALKDAEKAVRSASDNIANAATQLSTKVTLPILGFGVAALKSAGDIEALQKAMEATFKNAGRTIGEAGDELEALRRAAEAPGLDFPEAVKASIRLQNVGLSAEAARATIIELANAVATTGGSAENLGEVTNQFSQMIAKGKVYNEDLKIIKGQMPVIAGLMEETFGTSQAEKLQEMGVTGREFVERITVAMQGLNRAEGGISNAIVNAGTSIKMFLASVGESLNKTFNITGKLEGFASWLDRMAESFKGLDDGTKRAIGGVAVFALALGPMLKVGQGAVLVVGQMIKGFQILQIALLNSLAGQAIPSAIAAFKALNLATKLTILGAAIGIILAAAAAFSTLKTDMSAAAQAARSVEEVNKTAAQSIAGQKSEVDTLVAAYKAEGTTLEQKREILKKLNEISPEYFGQIRAGKGDITELTKATGQYVEQLINVARVTAAKDRLVEIERAMLDLNKTADPTIWQSVVNVVKSGGNSFLYAANQADSFSKNLTEQKEVLEAERDALTGIIVAQTKVEASNKTLSKSNQDVSDSAKKMGKVLKEVMSDVENAAPVAKLLGTDEDVAQIDALQKGIKKLVDEGFDPASKAVLGLKAQLDALTTKPKDIVIDVIAKPDAAFQGIGEISGNVPAPNIPLPPPIQPGVSQELTESQKSLNAYTESLAYAAEVQQQLNDKTFSFTEGLSAVNAKMLEQGNIMGAVFVSMGDAIAQAASQGETSFAKLAQAAVGSAAKVIRAWIQQGVAAAVAKALTSLPFPLNIAAGAAAGGLAAAAFTKAIGAIGVKGFANGTNNFEGGVALVGEAGRELVRMPKGSQVIPAPQTSQILNGLGGGGQQVVAVTGEFKIQGDALVAIVERTQEKNQRFK